MARRFFIDNNDINIDGNNISVVGDEIHHINVLRHKKGDLIKINKYIVKIEELDAHHLSGIIDDIEESKHENAVALSLYQSYIKADKMEYVVQKAVELGINKIVPFLSKNCVVKLDNNDKSKKIERLNKISLEASKQCGRDDVVKINSIFNIKEDAFKKELLTNDYIILAYENSNNNLKEILKNVSSKANSKISIGIVIGPEGGFDKSDIDILKSINNIYEVSLGKNILRAETASLNLISIINYEFNL